MKSGARLGWTLSIAGAVVTVPQAALAKDEVVASANVSTTGGYSTSPFAGVGPGLGSAYVQFDADPEVRVISERGVLAIQGHINYEHYFHRYSDTKDYQGGLDYLGMPTSRLTTHASASYDSSIIGGFDNGNPLIDPNQPAPPPTTGPDLGLFGTGTRRRMVNVAGDLAYTLSDRASLTANAFYNRARYGGAIAQSNYDGYGGGMGYSRRFSDHLQLGVQGSIDRYVYQGLFGHSQVYSLQATISDNFSSQWKLVGAVGASYSDRTIGGKTISPTGNLQLCRASPRSNLCATVSEAVLPTGFSGTVVTQTAAASYSYKLSEHSNVSVSVDYSHNNRPEGIAAITPTAFASSYVAAAATYDRTLRRRLHFLATTRYRSVLGGLGNSPADIGGTIGFSIRLGDYR